MAMHRLQSPSWPCSGLGEIIEDSKDVVINCNLLISAL